MGLIACFGEYVVDPGCGNAINKHVSEITLLNFSNISVILISIVCFYHNYLNGHSMAIREKNVREFAMLIFILYFSHFNYCCFFIVTTKTIILQPSVKRIYQELIRSFFLCITLRNVTSTANFLFWKLKFFFFVFLVFQLISSSVFAQSNIQVLYK